MQLPLQVPRIIVAAQEMLMRGVPGVLRRQVWLRCCRAAAEQCKVKICYAEIIACCMHRAAIADERDYEYVGQVAAPIPTRVD